MFCAVCLIAASCSSAAQIEKWPCEFDGKEAIYKSESGIEYRFVKMKPGWVRWQITGESFFLHDDGLNIEEVATTYYRLGDYFVVSKDLISRGTDQRDGTSCAALNVENSSAELIEGSWYSCRNALGDPAIEFQFAYEKGILKIRRADDPDEDTLVLQSLVGLGSACGAMGLPD